MQPTGLPAPRARAVRRARRAADLRRGRDRARTHGQDVRLRARGRDAGPAVRRQGTDRRLPAARRDAHDRAHLRGLPRAVTRTSGPSSTATPTPATRSPARPGIATLETFERERTIESLQPKIELLTPAARAAGRAARRASPRSVSAGSWSGSSSIEYPPEARMGTEVTLAARRRGAIVRPLGDVVVLMPALAIIEADLRRLVVDHRRRRSPRSTAPSELPAAPRRSVGRGTSPRTGVKSRLRAPQTGQNHVSGMSSNAVPGGMPPSGSPSSGS